MYYYNGNVGIATTTPGSPLTVAGVIYSSTGGFKFPDNTTQTTSVAIPSGAVMYFNLASCPTGWTALAAAQGRYLVGLPSAGTLAGTAGTALSNVENRAVGLHTHTATDAGHTHTIPSASIQSSLNLGKVASTAVDTASTNVGYASITVANSGTVAGTNAPYIQLLVCQKD